MSGKAVLIGAAMVSIAVFAAAFILRDRCEPAGDLFLNIPRYDLPPGTRRCSSTACPAAAAPPAAGTLRPALVESRVSGRGRWALMQNARPRPPPRLVRQVPRQAQD